VSGSLSHSLVCVPSSRHYRVAFSEVRRRGLPPFQLASFFIREWIFLGSHLRGGSFFFSLDYRCSFFPPVFCKRSFFFNTRFIIGPNLFWSLFFQAHGKEPLSRNEIILSNRLCRGSFCRIIRPHRASFPRSLTLSTKPLPQRLFFFASDSGLFFFRRSFCTARQWTKLFQG